MDPSRLSNLVRVDAQSTRARSTITSAAGGGNGSYVEFTLCVLTDRDRHLLKLANRNVSIGKWNFLGGKIEPGERIVQGMRREVFEESKGLIVESELYHGWIDCHDGNGSPSRKVHIFSSDSFRGSAMLGDSDEGRLDWFHKEALPVERMWKDVGIWLPQVYEKKRFEITIRYSSREKDKIEEAIVKTMKRSVSKS